MRRVPLALLWGLLGAASGAGCVAELDGRAEGSGDPGDPADDGPVELRFAAPAAGAVLPRDAVADSGELAAAIAVEVAVSGRPARVELRRGDLSVGSLDAAGRALVTLVDPGDVTLTATAYDAAGASVATASVAVKIVEPQVADCHGWLDLYGLDYKLGPANEGVVDPVTVTLPLNGMAYRYVSNKAPRTTMFMDCQLARSLARAAPILRARGVVEVADIGVYNYRCIGGGAPPCTRGMSQHAYAMGIDIAGFTDDAATFYSVNDDWVIDPTTEKTCLAATSGDKDALLHKTICALKAAGVWTIVLTPNYNADHRNHFHVDLTPGANFLRQRGGVDSGPDRH